jgi:hypothetical protein
VSGAPDHGRRHYEPEVIAELARDMIGLLRAAAAGDSEGIAVVVEHTICTRCLTSALAVMTVAMAPPDKDRWLDQMQARVDALPPYSGV